MRQIWKKVVVLVACAAIVVTTLGTGTAFAQNAKTEPAWPKGPSVNSKSAIVMEANTGTILYAKKMDEQHYPASITKILTTLLAIENCPLDEIVTFSADAVFKNEGNSSHISRDLNEQMTMEQCLYGVMLESANECAYAVAEHVGGGYCKNFIQMMNEKAQELGCKNTHFNNPNGLPDPDHVTSCYDMALISRAAIQNSTFRKIVSTPKYQIPPTNKHEDPTPLNNHHQMISAYKGSSNLYEYAIGGKTGYTQAAGNTLVTYAEKDGMLLICVVMVSDAKSQYTDTRKLFEYCFSHYKMYQVSENESRLGIQDANAVSLFHDVDSFAKIDEDAQIILPASADFEDTVTELNFDRATGSVLGTLIYRYADKQVGAADIIATGADAATYEFGKKAGTDESVGAVDEQNASQNPADSEKGAFGKLSEWMKKIPYLDRVQKLLHRIGIPLREDRYGFLLIGLAVLVAVIVLLVRGLKNAKKSRRRREIMDRRYKTIEPSNSRRGRDRRGRR